MRGWGRDGLGAGAQGRGREGAEGVDVDYAPQHWVDERPEPDHATVAVEAKAGSALVYLGNVWHGGGANTTDEIRLGVVLHYARSWRRPVENHVLVVPPDVARELPERLQELLGYNIADPFIGHVVGRHPRKLLT
jgi:ectoine hydroxylase-related dioxygenase (phytanoyl-CoA dioxygenase family)